MLALGLLALSFLAGGPRPVAVQVAADTPSVLAALRLTSTTAGFRDVLESRDHFGQSVAEIGDVDGDGVADMAVGSTGDDDGRSGAGTEDRGAVYVLFRRADGSVRSFQKISATRGSLVGPLEPRGGFGEAVAGLGDVDGDGVPDLAVGQPREDLGTSEAHGAIWILYLERDGSVKSEVMINRNTPGMNIPPGRGVALGTALVGAGDWNGDGTPDLVAGCQLQGNVFWTIFLLPDGSVSASRRNVLTLQMCGDSFSFCDDLDGDGRRELATTRGRSLGVLFLDAAGRVRSSVHTFTFGFRLATAAGDVDGDGRRELVVGTSDVQAVQVLRLNPDGTLASRESILASSVIGPDVDEFGHSVAFLGDADGDGRGELAFGGPGESHSFATEAGTLHTFTLGPNGTLLGLRRQGDVEGSAMEGTLDADDGFGGTVTAVGDVDGDGVIDLAAGVPDDRTTGVEHRGGVWLLRMNRDGKVKARNRIGWQASGFKGIVKHADSFGAAVAALGDLDADGTPDLAVGAPQDDDGLGGNPNANLGAIWVLFLRPDGGVKKHVRISAVRGGFHGTLHAGDGFGSALAAAGDLDGNGTCDLFVGAPGDDDGGTDRGAVWILHLRRDGSARFEKKLSSLAGGFGGSVPDRGRFGTALAALGDVDGDGLGDVAVGSPDDHIGGSYGAAWVLFLASDGSVRAEQRIARGDGGFTGVLDGIDAFGSALAGPGDLDGDGVRDLVVGAPGDDDNAFNSGAVWILSLERTGTVTRQVKIRTGSGGFRGVLAERDAFGASLAVLGDGNGDGVPELAVGAPGADGARPDHGVLWLLVPDALAALDFEHRGDSTPALDGLALSGSELGGLLTLRSAGANLGPVLFESRVGGPNDPSQDPDLLVGRGKVLLLQNPLEPVQTFSGYFDRPNDEPSGGIVRFELHRRVEPRSVALVDIDGSPARVTLTDEFGGRRVLDVPAGWTGDRLVDGTTGVLRLDLTLLASQPGHRGSAMGSESPGFRADAVVVIEVELGGSGALDDLVLDPRP